MRNRTGVTTRAAVTAVVAPVGVALAACGGGSNSAGTTSARAPRGQHSPATTTAADWKPVTPKPGNTLRTALDATNVQPAG
jgi:hypothetical protein